MKRERQAILSLVALGRITPREAERLLAAWNAGREELWVIGVFVAVCVAQCLPALEQLVHALAPGGVLELLHGVSVMMCRLGGVL